MNEGNMTQWQLFLTAINFVVGSALLYAPSLAATYAKEDAWLSMLVALGIGIAINLFGLVLLRRYGYASVFQIMEHVAGKWLGGIINVIFIFVAIHLAAIVVSNLSTFLITIIPGSNAWRFQWFILLVIVYALYMGLDVMGRKNEILSPIMFVSFYGSLALLLQKFSFERLLPVLDNGWMPVFQGAFPLIGFPFLDVFVFAAFFFQIRQKERIITTSLAALTIGGISLVLAVVFTLGVEGATMTAMEIIPTYTVMKEITIGGTFTRVEIFVSLVWVLALFIKIAVCFYAAVIGLTYMAKQKSHRPFLFPVVILIWAMANHLHPSHVGLMNFAMKSWTLYLLFLYVLVILVLIWGMIRKKDLSINDVDA